MTEQTDATRLLRAYQAQADDKGIDVVRFLNPDLPSIQLHSDFIRALLP